MRNENANNVRSGRSIFTKVDIICRHSGWRHKMLSLLCYETRNSENTMTADAIVAFHAKLE